MPGRGRSFTTRLSETQIGHYRACREADLSLPGLARPNFVTNCACREADLSLLRPKFIPTPLAERQISHYLDPNLSLLCLPRVRFLTAETQICHYRACRDPSLSLPRLPRGRPVTDLSLPAWRDPNLSLTALVVRQKRHCRDPTCHYRACLETDLSLPGLPRPKFVTTPLAEADQISHYRDSNLLLPCLRRGRFVSAETPVCHYRVPRSRSVTAKTQILHYRACRDRKLSLPHLPRD